MISEIINKIISAPIALEPPEHLSYHGWCNCFDVQRYITGSVLDTIYKFEVDELGRDRNNRIYLGPQSDGSGPDKLAVDFKFDCINAQCTFLRSILLQDNLYAPTRQC